MSIIQLEFKPGKILQKIGYLYTGNVNDITKFAHNSADKSLFNSKEIRFMDSYVNYVCSKFDVEIHTSCYDYKIHLSKNKRNVYVMLKLEDYFSNLYKNIEINPIIKLKQRLFKPEYELIYIEKYSNDLFKWLEENCELYEYKFVTKFDADCLALTKEKAVKFKLET